MSELIDRVAKAIKADMARQWEARPDKNGDWSCVGQTIDLSQMARAAIKAMREPTEVV
jgi:hypothetical protein